MGKRNTVKKTKLPRGGRTRVYICRPLEQLSKQLLYAPVSQREKQFIRAEKLHDEIDPEANYPFEFIRYRITGSRLAEAVPLVLTGAAVKPDLRLIIDSLTDSLDLPAEDEGGAYYTIGQVAERFHVSTKTVQRWRNDGLRWRSIRLKEGKKKQVVFPISSIMKFEESHRNQINKASDFARVDEEKRKLIVERAKAIHAAKTNFSFNQITTLIAKEYGVANETVRQILSKQEISDTETPIFSDDSNHISSQKQRLIRRAYEWGVPIKKMSERYGFSLSTLYRTINQFKLQKLFAIQLELIDSQVFERDDADEVILREPLNNVAMQFSDKIKKAGRNAMLPAKIVAIYEQAVVSDQQMRSLFIRMNYLKYKANCVRRSISKKEPKAGEIKLVMQSYNEACLIQNMLFDANLPTVLSLVNRHLISEKNMPMWHCVRLLEVANVCVRDAIEVYDASRSVSFSAKIKNRVMRELANEQQKLISARAVKRETEESLTKRLQKQISELKQGIVEL